MKPVSTLAFVSILALAGTASAHVSVSRGPAFASKSQKITFSVGHGCDGADTIGLRVVAGDLAAGEQIWVRY